MTTTSSEAILRCRRCDQNKTPEEMKRDKRHRSGFSSYCKRCHSDYAKDWQRRNPEHARRLNRESKLRNQQRTRERRRAEYNAARARVIALRRYKTDQAWYKATLAAQGGGCAICGTRAPGARAFSVDHDHRCCPKTPTCGRCTRGLLCHACNTAIAAWDTHPEWFAAAQAYVGRAR